MAPVLRDPATRRRPRFSSPRRRRPGGTVGPRSTGCSRRNRGSTPSSTAKRASCSTRSAFERGADTAALSNARAAFAMRRAADARGAASRAPRARSRAQQPVRQRRRGVRARGRHVSASARLARSSRRRQRERFGETRALFANVTLAVAKPRIAWTEAQARERFSDALGAAHRYASARRNRDRRCVFGLSVAPDSASRDDVKTELLAFIRARPVGRRAQRGRRSRQGIHRSDPSEELDRRSRNRLRARRRAASRRSSERVTGRRCRHRAIACRTRRRCRESAGRATPLEAVRAVQGALAGQAAYQRARMFLTTGTARRNARGAARRSSASSRATRRRRARRCIFSPIS